MAVKIMGIPLTLIGLAPSSAGPIPFSFAACILKLYSCPSVNPWTVNLVSRTDEAIVIHTVPGGVTQGLVGEI